MVMLSFGVSGALRLGITNKNWPTSLQMDKGPKPRGRQVPPCACGHSLLNFRELLLIDEETLRIHAQSPWHAEPRKKHPHFMDLGAPWGSLVDVQAQQGCCSDQTNSTDQQVSRGIWNWRDDWMRYRWISRE